LDTAASTAATLAQRPQTSPVGLMSPSSLESAYNISPLQTSGIQGQNQNIALFELDGYQQSDVNAYWQYYNTGTTSTLTNHLVDSFSGAAGQNATETTMDIEMVGSIAPQSNILVYEGPNTTQGVNDTYSKIVSDDQASIVSISWGLCEASSGTAELQTLNNIFTQGALEGMSFIAGAGDAGAYDCQDTNLAVDSPADNPNVTGVGATKLVLSSGAYGSETVWANANNHLHGPEGAGSGGGLSSYFKEASWQTGTGVSNQYSNGYREVPDVTAFGDNVAGYSVYCTVTAAACPTTGWIKLGGTSVAAPFWAACLLLINQYLTTSGQGTLGLVNPALYKLYNATQTYPAFHDITSGNNLYYPTTVGYDMASGLGSPDVYNIARDLVPVTTVSSSTVSVTPTPTVGVTPTPTAIITPTATPVTPTPTAAATPTATPVTPTPTVAATPTPTS
jgi:subtilase family serine protease